MDKTKFDEIVLAMLWYNEQVAGSAWKGFDWDATGRLFRAGMISNPQLKRKSVVLSENGAKKGAEVFKHLFGALH
jgi:hypothetical protein